MAPEGDEESQSWPFTRERWRPVGAADERRWQGIGTPARRSVGVYSNDASKPAVCRSGWRSGPAAINPELVVEYVVLEVMRQRPKPVRQ